jgi:hypothetical protein
MLFPDLMAAAIKGDDLQAFVSRVRAIESSFEIQ